MGFSIKGKSITACQLIAALLLLLFPGEISGDIALTLTVLAAVVALTFLERSNYISWAVLVLNIVVVVGVYLATSASEITTSGWTIIGMAGVGVASLLASTFE